MSTNIKCIGTLTKKYKTRKKIQNKKQNVYWLMNFQSQV